MGAQATLARWIDTMKTRGVGVLAVYPRSEHAPCTMTEATRSRLLRRLDRLVVGPVAMQTKDLVIHDLHVAIPTSTGSQAP